MILKIKDKSVFSDPHCFTQDPGDAIKPICSERMIPISTDVLSLIKAISTLQNFKKV